MIKYIDSHAHLSDNEMIHQADEILARAQQSGIEAIVNICTDAETLFHGLELAKRYPWIYNAAATTPHDVDKEGELMFAAMAQHARSGYLVAVGETGLDYHYTHSNRENQQYFLRRYLHLALETNLPVIIHCRDAFVDFFKYWMKNIKSAANMLRVFCIVLQELWKMLKMSLKGDGTFL